MNARHFLKKGDNDSEEVYQIFESNSSTNICIGDKEKAEEEEAEDDNESRFCYIVLDCDCKISMEEKGKVSKEIKVDYFQLARLSRKFQKMKQFCNFPFIKRFKFDIKFIKEDTFLEFIKSTQGEEFKITETNYFELYHLSKEWGTYELTNILKDYGKRHESRIRHIIEQYLYLAKEYDQQKEENIGKQLLNRREKYYKIEGNYNNYSNNDKDKDKEEHKNIFKNIFKNKFSEIKRIEEIIKNRIEECFKIDIFWGIRIETIHRLIKENSKQNYSHDLLLECIIESIEERKYLIELIDPLLISEGNHQKLVDLQYKLFKEWKNHKQSDQKYNNRYINMNLIFELLQGLQESNYNEDIKLTNKFKSEEINKLKRELEEKEKDIEQKGKELKDLRDGEMNFCNEIKKIKENIKEERKNVKRKERKIKIMENEVERNQKEVKIKKIKNQTREKVNDRREEENDRREEENDRRKEENDRREEENDRRKEENDRREEENKRNDEKRRKEVEIREKAIQEREEKVEIEKNRIENKEKEIIKNKKENEIKKEEIQKQKENIIERENRMEEIISNFEKEKLDFTKKMKDEEEKMKEKENQQQKLIVERLNQLDQDEKNIAPLMKTELETFLRENNLNSLYGRNGSGYEAIHMACINGNDKIVSYILSRNPNKLNVKDVFFYFD